MLQFSVLFKLTQQDVLWDASVYCARSGVERWTARLYLQSEGGPSFLIFIPALIGRLATGVMTQQQKARQQ